MFVDRFLNPYTIASSKVVRLVIPFLAIVGVLLSNYLVFCVVPNEEVMGAVQRIFYYHVGSAMACYACIAVLFLGSVLYLYTKHPAWDALSEAAGAVGMLFCTVVLASGMIWGHSAWNTWWRWEPRLVSFLVLWLILVAYVLLRGFTEDHPRQRNFSAVLGILSALNVPIVIFSIKLLDDAQQLHPEVVGKQGLKDARFVYTLIAANLTMITVAVWFMIVRLQEVLLKREIGILRREQH